MKRNRKWKVPDTVLERWAWCFSSYKSQKLKVKQWWNEAHDREKRAFFAPSILSEENFFNSCVLSQRICIKCISEYTYFFKSITLLHTLLLPAFKIVESLQCILNSFMTGADWFLYDSGLRHERVKRKRSYELF